MEEKSPPSGGWEAYTDGGREHTGVDAIHWIKEAIELGVGEILVTSVDRDGTRAGYDLRLTSAVTSFSPVPVIAHGGAGSLATIDEVVTEGKADAVALSSVLHYEELAIQEIKEHLAKSGKAVRI